MPALIITLALVVLLTIRTGLAGGFLIWGVIALASYWWAMT